MSHPLIPASLGPASVSMAMGQMNRLSTLAGMANVAQLHAKPPAKAPTSVIKVKPGAPSAGGIKPLAAHLVRPRDTRERWSVLLQNEIKK